MKPDVHTRENCDVEWVNGYPHWGTRALIGYTSTICAECRTRMVALTVELYLANGTCDCGGEASSGTHSSWCSTQRG